MNLIVRPHMLTVAMLTLFLRLSSIGWKMMKTLCFTD